MRHRRRTTEDSRGSAGSDPLPDVSDDDDALDGKPKRKAKDPAVLEAQRAAMVEFVRRWVSAREAAGMDYNELDRALGHIAHGYSSNMESGGRQFPTAYVIGKAAEAMGVRKGWLAFGEEPRYAPRNFDELARVPLSSIVSLLERSRSLATTIQLAGERWSIWDLVAVVDDLARDPSQLEPDGNLREGSWKDRLDRAGTRRRQVDIAHLKQRNGQKR